MLLIYRSYLNLLRTRSFMLQISGSKRLQTDMMRLQCFSSIRLNFSLLILLQAHIVDLRTIPEALPYFVTPETVEENSALLQQLPHLAACSITQALGLLTPAYKGHPRVMAYVLRVLESYPRERVTFFMPQLVQSLRYDKGVSRKLKSTTSLFSFHIFISVFDLSATHFSEAKSGLLLDRLSVVCFSN